MHSVELSEQQREDALCLARQTHARYRNNRGYYTNALRSHQVARLGEMAAEVWLVRSAPYSSVVGVFRDLSRDKDCDVEVYLAGHVTRVEVKTWSEQHWAGLGRCIAVGQLPALRAKADIVLWCVLAPSDTEVVVAGWNLVSDFGGLEPVWTGPPHGRKVRNLQMPLSDMREPESLVPSLNR